jgi:hypothetical protein
MEATLRERRAINSEVPQQMVFPNQNNANILVVQEKALFNNTMGPLQSSAGVI